MPTDADQVVLAPGSKPLLAAVVACEPGDVVLPDRRGSPTPPRSTSSVAAPSGSTCRRGSGGIPDPALLPAALARARAAGANPGSWCVTLPDNPTGLLARPDEVKELCRVAEAEDLVVVSDEIYRDVVFGSVPFVSPADLVPDRTITVTGLSKSLALGGWRVGAIRFPDTGGGARCGPAWSGSPARCGPTWPPRCSRSPSTRSTSPPTWCATATPPPACTAAVANAVHDVFARHGVLDVAARRRLLRLPRLRAVPRAADGTRHPGRFGPRPVAAGGARAGRAGRRGVRRRPARAALPGRHEPALRRDAARRTEALTAPDPLQVPHVAASLDRLDAVVAATVSA